MNEAKRLGLGPGKKARIGLHACRGLAALSGFDLAMLLFVSMLVGAAIVTIARLAR